LNGKHLTILSFTGTELSITARSMLCRFQKKYNVHVVQRLVYKLFNLVLSTSSMHQANSLTMISQIFFAKSLSRFFCKEASSSVQSLSVM